MTSILPLILRRIREWSTRYFGAGGEVPCTRCGRPAPLRPYLREDVPWDAASSLGLYLSKSVTFERFGALTADVAVKGLIAGASLMAGAFIAKRFVLKLSPDAFRLIMDAIMIVAGIAMLWTAATA